MPQIPKSPGRQYLGGSPVGARVRPVLDFTAGLRAQAGAAQEARGLAQDGQQLILQEIERADRLALTDADNRLAELETKLLYGAGNEKGLFARQKKDALGLAGAAREGHEKHVQEILGTLQSQRQKDAFLQRARGRQVDVARAAARHEAAEVRRWDDEVLETAIATGQNEAVGPGVEEMLSAGKVDRIQKAIGRAQGALLSHGERNGTDPRTAALLSAQLASKTHRAVVGRLSDLGMDLAAKEYAERFRKELLDDDLGHVDKVVKHGSTLAEALRLKREIMTASAGQTRAEALKMVEEIADPTVQQMVKGMVIEAKRLEAEDLEEQRVRRLAPIKESLLKSWKPGMRPEQVLGVQTWLALPVDDQKELMKELQEYHKLGDFPSDPVMSITWWGMTKAQKAALSDEEMEVRVKPRMSRAEYDAAKKERADARENPAAYDLVERDREDMLEAARLVGIGGLKPTDTWKAIQEDAKKSQAVHHFIRSVTRDLSAAAQERGTSKLGTLDKQAIINKAVLRHVKPFTVERDRWIPHEGGAVGPFPESVDIPFGDLRPGDKVPLHKIPPADLEKIKLLFEKRAFGGGAKYTENRAQRLYVADILGDTVLFESILEERD